MAQPFYPSAPQVTSVTAGCKLDYWLAYGSEDSTLASYSQSSVDFGAITSPKATMVPRGNANNVIVFPYGTDTANDVFTMRIIRWYNLDDGAIFMPQVAVDVTCTLGAASIDSNIIPTSYMCDTIVSIKDPGTTECTIFSPANDEIGHVRLALNGCAGITFDFAGNSTANSANCLFGFF